MTHNRNHFFKETNWRNAHQFIPLIFIIIFAKGENENQINWIMGINGQNYAHYDNSFLIIFHQILKDFERSDHKSIKELSRNIRIQVGQNSLLFKQEVSRSQKTQKRATLRKSFCINTLRRKDACLLEIAAPFAPNGTVVCDKWGRRLRQATRPLVSNDGLNSGISQAQRPSATASGNANDILWGIQNPNEVPSGPLPFR